MYNTIWFRQGYGLYITVTNLRVQALHGTVSYCMRELLGWALGSYKDFMPTGYSYYS